MPNGRLKETHFIEVAYETAPKQGQMVCGDTFLSKKVHGGTRVISVLSDGLGSGIKASVLSTLTTTMALKFVSEDVNIEKAAALIMETLPVCRTRKIAYSTFTIVDMDLSGATRIIEYDNPACLLIRDGRVVSRNSETFTVRRKGQSPIALRRSVFQTQIGDRIVMVSDGVTQSGIGRPGFPMGWEAVGLNRFVEQTLDRIPDTSALALSGAVVKAAARNDGQVAADDITCGVVYVRSPRRTLVMTGPPSDPARDKEAAHIIRHFEGTKIIAGGTTANIIARELGLPVSVDISSVADLARGIPPGGAIEGVDLVTEGTLTLSAAVSILEAGAAPDDNASGQDRKLVSILRDSDVIQFVVGTRINQAHQDPYLPKELDIRRNVVRRIANLLATKYLKTVDTIYL